MRKIGQRNNFTLKISKIDFFKTNFLALIINKIVVLNKK
jgi:hypothetical protein